MTYRAVAPRRFAALASRLLMGGLLVGGLLISGAPGAAAQDELRAVAKFRNWSVFVAKDAPSKYCYAATVPEETQASRANIQRGEPFLLMTDYPADDLRNELSVRLGYPASDSAPLKIEIDGRSFELFAQDDMAWLVSPSQDGDVVDAMRRGATAKVTATSKRGTVVTDRYSLLGFTAAIERVRELCP